MTGVRRLIYLLSALALMILLGGWGSDGHRKINQQSPACLPDSMQFLKASWAILLADHASDADLRKETDPSESPRHYINIDSYPEFLANGKIPMSFDSIVDLHGISFVLEKGILPWATRITFDSLRECFIRKDWATASLFAADLGHYIADGHQPLHLTRNYDGQYSGQDGIHSRYETRMIGKYIDEIIMTPELVSRVDHVTGFIFSYIYYNYQVLGTLLLADSLAHAVTGSTWSGSYYSHLWQTSKGFTTGLFNRASHSLAALIYTAWLEAGSPVMPASALEILTINETVRLDAFPNPFRERIRLSFTGRSAQNEGVLIVYNSEGKQVSVESVRDQSLGENSMMWDASGQAPGIYFFRWVTASGSGTARALLVK